MVGAPSSERAQRRWSTMPRLVHSSARPVSVSSERSADNSHRYLPRSPAWQIPEASASTSSISSGATVETALATPLPGPKFVADTPLPTALNSSSTGPPPLPRVPFGVAIAIHVDRSASSMWPPADGDAGTDELGIGPTSALGRVE